VGSVAAQARSDGGLARLMGWLAGLGYGSMDPSPLVMNSICNQLNYYKNFYHLNYF
jgi:hypothetical protein